MTAVHRPFGLAVAHEEDSGHGGMTVLGHCCDIAEIRRETEEGEKNDVEDVQAEGERTPSFLVEGRGTVERKKKKVSD